MNALGLSSAHNGTFPGDEASPEAPDDGPPPGRAVVEVWPNAALYRVRRAPLARSQRDGADVHRGGGAREVVTRFTNQARRRMMTELAKLDRDAPALLVTLTYPLSAAPTPETWKLHRRRFEKRFARAWSDAAYIWRREFTKAGVVHLHLLVFRVSFEQMLAWVPSAWAAAVDCGVAAHLVVGTSVEVPHSRHAVQSYCAKYAAKRSGKEHAGEAWGRWYGYHNRAALPFVQMAQHTCSPSTMAKQVRVMQRAMEPPKGSKARRAGVGRKYSRQSLSIIGRPEVWTALERLFETGRTGRETSFAACSVRWARRRDGWATVPSGSTHQAVPQRPVLAA